MDLYLLTMVDYDIRYKSQLEQIDIFHFKSETKLIEYIKGYIEYEADIKIDKDITLEKLRKILLSSLGKLVTIKKNNRVI